VFYWSRKNGTRRCLAFGILVLVMIGCDEPTTDVQQSQASVITWGTTGIMYVSSHDNLRMLRNFLSYLGRGHDGGVDIRILYTMECDPRTHQERCWLVSDIERLDPFFNMIAEIGSIEFVRPSLVDLYDSDVVIADFCKGAGDEAEIEHIREYVESGRPTLVLAGNHCSLTPGKTSAAAANEVLSPLGLTFSTLDPRDPTVMQVPEEHRTGLLGNVSSVWIWRVVPQSITRNFEPVLESDLGVLAAIGTFEWVQ
jgi:hypothetical protein